MSKGETYLKGRTAGVEGTYGEKRKGGVEKTVVHLGDNEGGGSTPCAEAARGIYEKALRNGGGSDTGGDEALRKR